MLYLGLGTSKGRTFIVEQDDWCPGLWGHLRFRRGNRMSSNCAARAR